MWGFFRGRLPMQKRSRTTFGFRLVSIVLLLSLLAVPVLSGTAPFGGHTYAAEDADWQFQNNFHRFLSDVDAVDTSSAWVIGGREILRTTDGGDTWMQQEYSTGCGFDAVSACNASEVWVVGNNNSQFSGRSVIIHTDNGGEEWVTQLDEEGYCLRDVCAVGSSNAWAVGDNGTVLTTSDGGATWVSRDCGTKSVLNSVWALDADTAWVAGEGGTILKTVDNGLTWETLDAGGTRTLYGIHTLDGSIIWAVGALGTVLKSSDGGHNWVDLSLGTDYALKDICAVDSQNIWTVGDTDDPSSPYYPMYGKALRSSDGGESWMVESTIYYEAPAVSACDANTAWLVGGDIDILKTTDGGETWVDQWPATICGLTGVSAVDSKTAWVARGAGDVLKTTDGGTTWVSTDTGPDDWERGLYDVSAVDVENAWAVGGDRLVLRTEDGGETWLPFEQWIIVELHAIAAIDSDIAWAAGESQFIMKTVDGGENWWIQHASTTLDVIGEIFAVSTDIVWAVGYDFETRSSAVLKTVDGGNNWDIHDFGDWEPGLLYAVDENVVWAVANYGRIIKSTDGGEHWEAMGYVGDQISCLFALDDCTAWVAAYGYDDGLSIYKTCDGGASWHAQMEEGEPTYPWHIEAGDCCSAWVVGASGMIMHTSNGGDDWPDLLSLSPASGGSGAEVTISGCDFGDTRDSSAVLFGDTPAQDYVSWSDDQVVVRVPELAPGETRVTVATSAGTSNWKTFTVEPLSLQAVVPDQAMQHTISLDLELSGTGFQPGSTVELRRGDLILSAYNVQVVSDTLITCTCGFFGAEAGAYDVAVTGPGGVETVLAEGFTVTPICGTGSGAAVLMLGLSLGLLSATFSLRRRRRKT